MSSIVITGETLQAMKLFEQMSGAKVKDCFEDTLAQLTFVVEQGEIAKAIGKNAVTVMKAREQFHRPIRVIEFNSDIKEFIANVVRPNKLTGIEVADKTFTMLPPDLKTRGYLIGRNASALRNAESIVKKYFELQELKVGQL